MRNGCRRHRRQEPPPVPHRPQARIEDREHTAIVPVTDEAAQALQQRKDGQRHLVLAERIAALHVQRFHPCGGHRIAGRGERQLVDDHAAQRVADDVDALPEARGREQDRVRRHAELGKQGRSRGASLHQQRVVELHREHGLDRAQHRVAREEHERAAFAA
jgi:hypothetical protein